MMKIKFSILVLLSYLFILQPSSVRAQSQQTDKFMYDLLSSVENPRNSEGDFIPLKDGRILFAYTRFMSSSSDHAPAQIMGRFSKDGGITWSGEDQLIVDREG